MPTDSEPHHGDLLLLCNDNFLSKPLDLRVAPVAKHRSRHRDRALMVRHHHGDEVGINIACGLHCHIVHHFLHGCAVLGHE